MQAKQDTEARPALSLEFRDILSIGLVQNIGQVSLVARQASPRVSVRATILSLSRFGIVSKDVTKRLEKEWASYRKLHQLDLYGQRESELSQPSNHAHT